MTAQHSRDTIALVGGGKMGEALLAGLVREAGPEHVVVVEPVAERAAGLRERYGIGTPDLIDAVTGADTVVVCVKPAGVGGVLDAIRDVVPRSTVVVSIAAGLPTSFLESHLAADQPVVRVMPNTPSFLGAGMAAMSPGSSADESHLDRAEQVLAAVGRVVRVDEELQDAVTAVSGSGPAYVFYLVEAMADAGVALGLDREIAVELAVQTAYGAGLMLREAGEAPSTLRANVTSPNGTTAAAIASLDDSGARDVVAKAMRAARDRSVEMGRDPG